MNEEGIKRNVIVIGTSAGGVSALQQLCAALPADFPAIVGVVIHRSPWSQSDVPALYGRRAKIPVREAKAHDRLELGTVYFAPPDQHMLFKNPHIELSRSAKVHFVRPAVDCLFVSAATTFKHRVVGVLLTGGGSDGAQGLVKIKGQGGLTLVQKPEEASHPSMPLSGLRENSPEAAVSLSALPAILVALAKGERIESEASGPTYLLMGQRWV
jgi:two-component system, chemotaxis family, protein-glutamate methylesterase/glutaminase